MLKGQISLFMCYLTKVAKLATCSIGVKIQGTGPLHKQPKNTADNLVFFNDLTNKVNELKKISINMLPARHLRYKIVVAVLIFKIINNVSLVS